jgi:hypothetical protein
VVCLDESVLQLGQEDERKREGVYRQSGDRTDETDPRRGRKHSCQSLSSRRAIVVMEGSLESFARSLTPPVSGSTELG